MKIGLVMVATEQVVDTAASNQPDKKNNQPLARCGGKLIAES